MSNINLYQIKKTKHYKIYHEKDVNWENVINTIYTAPLKIKGKNIYEFKSKTFYILCKEEGNILKVINAKRIKK